MRTTKRVLAVIGGFLGAIILAAAGVSPESADSNIAAWLKHAGWTHPPVALASRSADHAIQICAGLLIIVCLCLFFDFYPHFKRRRLQSEPLPIFVDEGPNEFKQLGMTDRIIVRHMSAHGRLSDGQILIHAEAKNVWDEEIELARLKGKVLAELDKTRWVELQPLAMVTDPGAAPGKILVIGFHAPVPPSAAEMLRPLLVSPDGLLLNLQLVEVWVHAVANKNNRARLELWEGLCLRGDGNTIVSSQHGWPQVGV